MSGVTYAKLVRIGERQVSVQGSREYVEEEFEKLLKYVFRTSDLSAYLESIEETPEVPTRIPITIRDLFERKNPKSKLDSLLLIGYYLEKVVGMEAFTKEDLLHHARKDKILLGLNLTRDLRKLVSQKSLMEKHGEIGALQAFRLTLSGEQYVEDLGA